MLLSHSVIYSYCSTEYLSIIRDKFLLFPALIPYIYSVVSTLTSRSWTLTSVRFQVIYHNSSYNCASAIWSFPIHGDYVIYTSTYIKIHCFYTFAPFFHILKACSKYTLNRVGKMLHHCCRPLLVLNPFEIKFLIFIVVMCSHIPLHTMYYWNFYIYPFYGFPKF